MKDWILILIFALSVIMGYPAAVLIDRIIDRYTEERGQTDREQM